MTEQSETILDEAKRLVYGPRQDAYGHPKEDFERTAKLWDAILFKRLNSELTAQDVALCMIALKLSREVHKHKRDNLVDLAGYAATAEMLNEEEAPHG